MGNRGLSASRLFIFAFLAAVLYFIPYWSNGSGSAHAELAGANAAVQSDYTPSMPSESDGGMLWHNYFATDSRETPMVGDFNGDGLTDIMTLTRDNSSATGQVYVALSDGTQFGQSQKWNDWFAVSRNEYVVVGDFDGDGKDDVATWLMTSTGQVYVALSTGSGLNSGTLWLDNFGTQTYSASSMGNGGGMGDGSGTGGGGMGDGAGGGMGDGIGTGGGGGMGDGAGGGMGDGSGTGGGGGMGDGAGGGMGDGAGGGMGDGSGTGGGMGNANKVSKAADVNGDGLTDLVLFDRGQGKVYVALSTGTSFASPEVWHDFFAVSMYERPELADIDGDGKADIITFSSNNPMSYGKVYVALSTGSQFGDGSNSTKWSDWFGVNPMETIRMGDLNADAKADFVTFLSSREVYVSHSNGDSMATGTRWTSDYDSSCSGSSTPFVGDVSGDGKADIIDFCRSDGTVSVLMTP